VRFSDAFLRFECIPLTVWLLENVRWLSGVMMLFKYCVIVKMEFIQQLVSVAWTRSHRFGCLFKVAELLRAARRDRAFRRMCFLVTFSELSPENGSRPKYSLKREGG